MRLVIVEAAAHGSTARYVLPLATKWTRFDRERHNPKALAAVRQGASEGTLLDIAADEDFITLLIDHVAQARTIEAGDLHLEFRPTSRMRSPIERIPNVRAVETEQSNSTALVGDSFVVKLFRRLEPGINPEIEVGRFLTEVAHFSHTPALLGTVELVQGAERSAVAVVHAFVENQGDAWTVTGHYLDRFVDEQRLLAPESPSDSNEQTAYLRRALQIGGRVAEMQLALASEFGGEDFQPEPIVRGDVLAWTDGVMTRAERVFRELSQRRADLAEPDRYLVDQLLPYREGIAGRLTRALPEQIDAMKIRHHGDFHLGQMLIVKDDVFIIDFEGEPRRSLEERRRKAPAARDVAGLIRSVDYSATAALERALQAGPDEHGKIAAALEDWRAHAVAAFLSAYRERLAGRLWPADRATADRLLDFFLLEKAFYEIEYELAHRPGWVRVPLRGALRILSRFLGAAA
jgi:maltose alpha-D-glucosyltransferase/alpha-amylase